MNNIQLFELLQIDPRKVPNEVEFWALYASSFYEKLFGKISNLGELEKVYNALAKNPRYDKRTKEALEFFYAIRIAELEDPHFWDKVGMKKVSENMKTKLVKESLNEVIKASFEDQLINKIQLMHPVFDEFTYEKDHGMGSFGWIRKDEKGSVQIEIWPTYGENADDYGMHGRYDSALVQAEARWIPKKKRFKESEESTLLLDEEIDFGKGVFKMDDNKVTEWTKNFLERVEDKVMRQIYPDTFQNESLNEYHDPEPDAISKAKMDFRKVVAELEKRRIPCKVQLMQFGGRLNIDVLCGFDYPDSLFDKVSDASDAVGVDVDVSADQSGGTTLDSERIAGGPKRYERGRRW